MYSQAMKNRFYENLRRNAKDYHRSHSLELGGSGIYTDHLFESERLLSWWQDFSFILNKRRVSVWWIHPRMRYADETYDQAYVMAGESPVDDHELLGGDTTWKRVGRSRKKIVWYRSREMPAARREHFDQLNAVHERLTAEGIEYDVTPSISAEYFRWGTGVSLCVPMEVRTHTDGVALVVLTRRLLTRQTTYATEFGDYRYGKSDWLREADARAADTERRRAEDGKSGEPA